MEIYAHVIITELVTSGFRLVFRLRDQSIFIRGGGGKTTDI